MSFKDFIHESGIKNKAKSDTNITQKLSFLVLSDVVIYLRDCSIKTDIGIVTLHPSKLTQWLSQINQNYLNSNGGLRPEKLSKSIIKRNGNCLSSKQKTHGLTNKRSSYCAAYCLYNIYLTNNLRKDFESAVLNLYCQRFSFHKLRYRN